LIDPSNGAKFTVESPFLMREASDPYLWFYRQSSGSLTFGDPDSTASKTVGGLLIAIGFLWPLAFVIILLPLICCVLIIAIAALLCCVAMCLPVLSIFLN
jgi:hypothetical protein